MEEERSSDRRSPSRLIELQNVTCISVGKHLVLVTDPEIAEDAYAFDNPCFKDATPAAVGRVTERPSSAVPGDTPAKDSTRWSTPWTSLGLGSAIRSDKRRTLDDSCVGPKATRVSVVSLRSHDFTGLGFNICGNMREGIFVKDLLHRGPASESGRIHPGDRITSVKISFRNMVYEDALTILSYASPYDVELEVMSGGSGSKPTTLMKKSVGPTPTRICHPLYRSQSIPELSRGHKNVAKRLFIADPNESMGSNYSTMNSTLKSSKSTPGSGQSLERRHDEAKNNHHKFGIKVLPALDGTVHRIENQNEHNTNLERRHSRKMDAEKLLTNRQSVTSSDTDEKKLCNERLQQRSDGVSARIADGVHSVDVPDKGSKNADGLNIPSEVPTEVHNAAMAARRNRKSSSEPLNVQKISSSDSDSAKSPQKNKRKAPAPPKSTNEIVTLPAKKDAIDTIDSIADYSESLCDYVNKTRENTNAAADARRHRLENAPSMMDRRNSESDTDNEMQNSFTIELNSADITIHRTPVPEADDDEDEDDMYRKAASLGDLSKYENKTAATLERAQSLDMSADTGAKKRKAPLPPEDINESTEDLTKLDQIDTFDRRKLKKSNEWGTLEDVLWGEAATETEEKARGKVHTRKKSNGTLERSKSAVEIKLKEDVAATTTVDDMTEQKKPNDDSDQEITSIELYNLPLSKQLTEEFIRTERMFNPDQDNSLARIVNDGQVVKSLTPEEVELNFQLANEKQSSEENKHEIGNEPDNNSMSEKSEDFSRALRYFELHASSSPTSSEPTIKVNLTQLDEWKEEKAPVSDASLYTGRQPVVEEPILKVTVDTRCRGCEDRCGQHSADCKREKYADRQHIVTVRSFSEDKTGSRESTERETERTSTPTHLRVYASKSESSVRLDKPQDKDENAEGKNGGTLSTFHAHRTKFEQRNTDSQQHDRYSPIKTKSPTDSTFVDTHFARRIINVSNRDDNEEEEDEYEFGTNITANNKNLSSPKEDRHNISSVSVSSGENSEDSGLVRESMDYNNPQDTESRPSLPNTPVPPNAAQKMTYITEIKVSSNREGIREIGNENEEITTGTNGESRKPARNEIKVTTNGKSTSGKKPPVPPRRSDITKSPKEDQTDKQVVYVSEYKSAASKGAQILDAHPGSEIKQSENKKFEHWIFRSDKEQNRWNPASGQPQPVTNIMLSSRDDTN
ncbi:Periaxin [Cyphomyrmex costatus]|uniref:Periaxin n=1 Tax=Cyphomyrmex costatus TaxID=456900 RepID=A0A195CZT2_9HYME|nr:Periaxin [Cyphomyrmex costatus]